MICPPPTVLKRPQATIETVEEIPDLKIIRPKAFPDERGFFCESYNADDWAKTLNFHEVFKQVAKLLLFCDFFYFFRTTTLFQNSALSEVFILNQEWEN